MSRRIITAVDVGSFKITTVIAALEETDQHPTVVGVCNQPSHGIRKGVVVNIDEATNAIAESISGAERMAGITVSEIYLTINGEQIASFNNRGVVAVASGSEITMDDTYRAIENARTLTLPENLNPIHIIPREFVVDNQGGIKYPIGMTGARLEVETHIITAPTSTWLNLRKCVENLGFSIQDIVFAGWSSALAVLTDTEKELGVTMLDIGSGTTCISIFEEGAIVFSGCIPIGGVNITSDLAIGLQVSLDDAERIKVNMNRILEDKIKQQAPQDDRTPALLRKNEEVKKEKKETDTDIVNVTSLGIKSKTEVSKTLIKQIVDARLEEIFEMARDVVSKAGFDMSMPAGIVLTGGTSMLKDINKVAQAVYGVPARIGYPVGLTGMVEEVSDPAYAAVQGLIKHAMDDEGQIDTSGKRGAGLKNVAGVFGKIGQWIKSLMPGSN